MTQRVFRTIVTALLAATFSPGICLAQPQAKSFPGWPVMHVIKQEGMPRQTRVADLNQDGRAELVVVNTRQSRLEVYRWLPPDQRKAPGKPDPDRPNELPMTPQFEREEIALERLPLDVLVANLDDDKALELIVLERPPLRVAVYDQDDKGDYHSTRTWDLLEGSPSGPDQLMKWHKTKGQQPTLLISFSEGIQQLVLAKNERASWVEPREKKGRVDWWQTDLDGDGDIDLVEFTRIKDQTVRWYEAQNGQMLPAAALTDLQADVVEVIEGKAGPQILLLGGLQDGVLKRFALGTSEPKPLGHATPLPIAGADSAAWTGAMLGDRKALVVIDSDQPRAIVHWLTDKGWQAGPSFPMVSNITAIVAPAAKPGTLLLWTKDGTDLYECRWENGRLTYPRPRPSLDPKVEDRAILALDTVGQTTWWAQRVDDGLGLYLWKPDADEPIRIVYLQTGKKIDRVQWLGGDRMLLLEKFARSPKLVMRDAESTVISEPAHLKKAKLEEFKLIGNGDKPRLCRMTDGVLQWLDDDLQPTDQVMLPDGLRLVDYLARKDGSALALDSSGHKIHQLKADEAGVMRVAQSFDITGGMKLANDNILGLLVVDREHLVSLRDGKSHKLELVDSIDSRVGRPSGVREATIHRMFITDVTGDGQDEIVLTDDRRHQLTVLQPTADGMEALVSWPVYEDKTYPYGHGVSGDLVREPRQVQGLDFENDGKQDLILLSHDRLLIYLGAKEGK